MRFEKDRLTPPAGIDHDVVVLAGDITASLVRTVLFARTHFTKPVIIVAGNHEFYGGEIDRDLSDAKALACHFGGIHILENDCVVERARFMGATLWTDFDLFVSENRLDSRIAS